MVNKAPHSIRTVSAPVCSVIVITGLLYGLYDQFSERSERILLHARRIEASTRTLNAPDRSNVKVAFWTESHQDYLGPISFHWWGNYRYARGAFSEDLATAYPGYMFISLRNVWRSAFAEGSVRTQRAPSRWGWLGERWRAFESRLAVGHIHEAACILLPCRTIPPEVSVVMFPVEEYDELRSLGPKALDRWVKDNLGQYTASEYHALDTRWEAWTIRGDGGM